MKSKNTLNLSLKENHRRKAILERRVRERIIAESKAELILEVLNKDDLRAAKKVLDKFGPIEKIADSDPNLKDSLGAALKAAREEVNAFTPGGFGALMKKGATAIASKFGAKAGKNPILKATMLMNALESGFKNMPDVIKNNAPNFDEKSEKKLSQQLDDAAYKNVQKAFRKAFVPEGVFASIKSLFGASSGGLPYINSMETFVDDIMTLPSNKLVQLIKAVTEGPSTEDLSSTVKDATSGSASGSSAPSASGTPAPVTSMSSLATALAAGSAADKGRDAGEATEKAKENPKALVKDFITFVKNKSNQDEDTVKKVLSALLKKGKIKSSFAVAESNVRISKNTLTMNEVLDAQMALLKSGGSTKRWVKKLFEIKVSDELENALKGNKYGEKVLSDFSKDELPFDDDLLNAKNNALGGKLGKGELSGKEVRDLQKELDKIVDSLKSSSTEKRTKEDFKSRIEDCKSVEEITDILDEMDPDGKKKVEDMPVSLIIKYLNKVEDDFKTAKSSRDKKEAIRDLKKIPGELDFLKVKVKDLLVNPPQVEPSGKHANVIKSVQKDLEGIDVKSIEAILDAIPDYLKVENKKYLLSVI